MHQHAPAYKLPPRMSLKALGATLLERLPLRPVESRSCRRVVYDTFDWRLYGAGEVMESETNGTGHILRWRELSSGDTLGSAHVKELPRFAWDLPPGALRDALGATLGERALLPLTRLRCREQVYALLNAEEKTVLRLIAEETQVETDTVGKRRARLTRIRLAPVRGYHKAPAKVRRVLERDLQLTPDPEDPLLVALKSSGHSPGGYDGKLHIELLPHERADSATKRILLALLDTMRVNEPGMCEDLDSEFLHDYRVSVRRTRSALSQVKGVFPSRVVERYKAGFAWLGQVTTRARDMDVYLLAFDDYKRSLPAAMREDLEPLRAFLQHEKEREYTRLRNAMGSARYRRMVDAWRSYLEAPLPRRALLPNAGRPVKDVANERIHRMYRRVLKEGSAIKAKSPPEALHELRKSCKKLRYLMEFFRSLYPPQEIGQLIKTLKTFQDNLGAFQDLSVQEESLEHFSEAMAAQGKADVGVLRAIGTLVEGLKERQVQVRAEFAERFAAFAARKNHHRFDRLFAPHRLQVAQH